MSDCGMIVAAVVAVFASSVVLSAIIGAIIYFGSTDGNDHPLSDEEVKRRVSETWEGE